MKYILINDSTPKKAIMDCKEFSSFDEAKKEGQIIFDHFSEYDRKYCDGLYILESINPDEESINHFDGNIVYTWL